MASDSQTDDAVTRSLRQAVGQLVSRLSRAIFGVCAVAVGLIALFVGAGASTGESTSVVLILGTASILVGFVTISRLPKPSEAEPTDTVTVPESTAETPSETAEAVDGDNEAENTDRHRQQAD